MCEHLRPSLPETETCNSPCWSKMAMSKTKSERRMAQPVALVMFQLLLMLLHVVAFAPSSLTRLQGVAWHQQQQMQSRSGRRGGLMMQEEPYEKDAVERLYSFFFGEKEEAPFGLARITKDEYPDVFPAVKGEFAEPVKGDDKNVAMFRPLLKQTALEKRKLKLVYDAKKQGFKPTAFHKAVDKKGAGVVLIKTKGGAVCGGYNAKGWVGYGENRPGISSFLFTWPDGNTGSAESAVKLRKIGGAGMAIVDKPGQGPFFGADSLCVPLTAAAPRQVRSKLGSYYERMPGGKSNIFAKEESGSTEMTELKVYTGVYPPGEKIPNDDALPFSLS